MNSNLSIAVALLLLIAGCAEVVTNPRHSVIPIPTSVAFTSAEPFDLSGRVKILYDAGDSESARIGSMLADLIGNTVETMPAVEVLAGEQTDSTIYLTLRDAPADVGPEGYDLTIASTRITIRAAEPAGLFYGVQTLRQLLPPLVEYTAAYVNPLPVPPGHIRDQPRFEWRGAMLDVARHFLPAPDVKRFIDLMALYKLNRLHLHLSDDQGWRVEIPGRPRLTEHGGQLQVGGKGGGFYSTEQYTDLVQYAADRFITVVPEIDLPGHTTAALASYPELNCDGLARELYTGTGVGFSSVCPESEETFRFIDDVVREISAMTLGPYFHMGGDEVETLTEEQYVAFVLRVQKIVEAHGKRLVGWDEVSFADLDAGSRVQLWRPLWSASSDDLDSSRVAAANALKERVDRSISRGVEFILSPANKIYLDMKYDDSTVLGLKWAGLSDEKNAYDWDVADIFSQIPETAIAGVEATLWSETFGSIHDIEYMAFPRLPGVAELGWSTAEGRSWEEYRRRIAMHEDRWKALGVNYRRSNLIPWPVR